MVADLTLLTTGEELLGVFPAVDLQAQTARVVIVTPRHIVEAYGGQDKSEARVVPRTGVREVQVHSALGIYSESQTRWPGPMTVLIRVDGFEEPLALPLSQNTLVPPDMRSLLKGFLDDL
jgi:hypothetical protein